MDFVVDRATELLDGSSSWVQRRTYSAIEGRSDGCADEDSERWQEVHDFLSLYTLPR